ncbi:MAG: hypothetical protein AAGF14_01960 [Pseudomonadota bacterium]
MSDRRPIKVLLTGFGPFPGVHTNLSGDFLQEFEARFSPLGGDVQLRTEVLDTSWTATEDFARTVLPNHDPDIALHFGVHRRAGGFRIETRAQNRASPHADVDGKVFGKSCLMAEAPSALRSNLPASRLVQALLSRGLPASPSRDAGRYLCNMLLYLSLLQSKRNTGFRQTGFIHIPHIAAPSRHTPRTRARVFDMAALLEGAEVIVNQCVVHHRRNAQLQAGSS